MKKRYLYKIQIMLISCIFIAGCSQKEKSDSTKLIHKDFDANIKSIISGEYGEDFRYISLNGQIKDSLSKGVISSAIADQVTYEYKDVKIEDNAAVVKPASYILTS